MTKQTKQPFSAPEKRRLWIYLALAFGLPYVMGIPMGISQRAGNAVDAFPSAQMFYPAAAVMVGLLATAGADPEKKPLPRLFYGYFLALTAVMAGCALASAALPGAGWAMGVQVVIILGSLLGWVFLRLDRRRACAAGLGAVEKGKRLTAVWVTALFLALYLARVFATAILAGQWGEQAAWFASPTPYILMISLVPSFFLSFAAFLGEEYGWRYYLQPVLQKRFGLRLGTLALGVAWGLWHLPLNLFYYSPQTSLQSIAAQLITCVSLGIYFAFAYLKTGSVWVPVVLHFLNNNMIPVVTGSVEISNQVYGWADVGLALILNAVVFLPFLASRVFRAGRERLPA